MNRRPTLAEAYMYVIDQRNSEIAGRPLYWPVRK